MVMEILLLLGVICGLVLAARHIASRKGSGGESAVNDAIEYLIKTRDEYRSFNNVILGTPDGTTEIDHILVSPYGIFVVETKNYKGWIFGEPNQKRWTQSLKRSYKLHKLFNQYTYQFQNPLHQNYKHVKAVQKFLGADLRNIFSVVVFSGDSEFMTPMPNNVILLDDFLSHIGSYMEEILDGRTVDSYCRKLKDYIDTSGITVDDHVENLERNASNPMCPRCGKEMVVRVARRGSRAGSEFWGCSNYPTCRATKNATQNYS